MLTTTIFLGLEIACEFYLEIDIGPTGVQIQYGGLTDDCLTNSSVIVFSTIELFHLSKHLNYRY